MVDEVGGENIIYGGLLLLFILLASLTVMNMLVGVLVEVVSTVAAVEKEQMEVSFVRQHLMRMMDHQGLDADADERISKKEFEDLLLKPEAAKALQNVGVDVVGLVDFTDFIFKDDTPLTL